ncbi:MAG: phosphoethanolamine transferase, partial [Alphaproteobacteria bacterium]
MICPSRFQIKSNTLIWILSLYFATVLNLAFYKYVITHIEITSVSVLCFALSLIVFITAPFYVLFNLILWPYIGKMLIVLLLLISASANYMMFFYGIYIDTDMVRNVFETNTREALDLVTFSGFLWVLITGIMPAVLLMISVVRYHPMKKECVFRLIMVGLCLMVTGAVGALTYKEYASFGRNHRDVRKLLNTINYTYSTVKYIKLQSLANREFVILDDKAHLEPLVDSLHTVLIYIVGETARAQNFSLNGYDRETNPLLKKQDIVNFNQMAACGTATAVSLPCMFSNQTRSDFDVTDAKYTENVLDLLEKGGYDIYWRENDDGCKSVCPRVNYIDMQQTKHPKFC